MGSFLSVHFASLLVYSTQSQVSNIRRHEHEASLNDSPPLLCFGQLIRTQTMENGTSSTRFRRRAKQGGKKVTCTIRYFVVVRDLDQCRAELMLRTSEPIEASRPSRMASRPVRFESGPV